MIENLNPQQRAAVSHIESPLLVLAGAGSGKTRVITQKIAHLILDRIFLPEHIAAVTFTNKAAREMQQRVSRLMPQGKATGLQVSTFHTLGLRILRKEYEKVGLRNGFTIYDSQDSSALLRELLRKEGPVGNDMEDPFRWQISQWKNAYITPEQALAQSSEPKAYQAALLYARYDHFLRTYNAVDFDDLIILPAMLFQQDPETLGAWRERIRYLLVDEYQDTNTAQYQLVRMLVGSRKGLTVVGDDDQSVYGWRGAQPENLQLLLTDYPDLKVIKLEQNYRSMGNILHVANALIANNPHQFSKRLWSEMGHGEPIRVHHCRNADHEAERVVGQILHHRFKHNNEYRDYAILYRGNHQSRPFERLLREHRMPYYLSGGISFFERTEIKDLMAYLRLLVNPDDDTAFLRAVNTPRRGLGPGTIEKLAEFAQKNRASLFTSCFEAELATEMSARAYKNLMEFCHWLNLLGDSIERGDSLSVVQQLIDDIGYQDWLEGQSSDPQDFERRWENVQELLEWMKRLARDNPEHGLSDWLARMTLSDLLDRDEDEENRNAVFLMTLHAAKGLEFDHVYIVGMEEELLPHKNSLEDSLEEERRLAYVGITRARKSLNFSFAATRKRYGDLMRCEPSRFLEELPADYLSWEDLAQQSPEERRERGNAHLAHLRSLLTE